MEKRNNTYHLDLKEISLKDGSTGSKTLSLEFKNHDDLFHIFELIRNKNIFDNEQTANEFALGLKLFTEVMITHKDLPIFEELKPAIGSFMKKLKSL
ncbi:MULTISPECIES: DUF3861 domain-containing protein [Chryseobacterium]|uniref:DUF3861 family protein n=1 Tax=Chryseobacterium camelliae TaxID=1265445 RepID=A0ABU0TDC2_9FLAO|nr:MULTISPECIES: DUF3861 domain-containing protein [Chryseobacterium]MDT3407161.1 hypothetical protein [Pseudacidovorax intermedius]MDQ1095049.1 hypothetical protein [Chryseobacterium camelliae]MDQ1098988.1 hypothetical protein [Chryseobacterium sp. SORGH_AS_1048]MDR6086336.1 hypothetical protein [Chryseobacterium sp. SORGH_AS_0909]MDR6130708.1 hypothetical protein [Chryseobacterium sp. SORGH_AS_1175]